MARVFRSPHVLLQDICFQLLSCRRFAINAPHDVQAMFFCFFCYQVIHIPQNYDLLFLLSERDHWVSSMQHATQAALGTGLADWNPEHNPE